MDAEGFIQSVDSLLAYLRRHLLGLDSPVSSLLPEPLQKRPPEERAKWLADRLLYAVAQLDGLALPCELEQLRGWLYEVVLYLITNCLQEDQTVSSILRLLELDPEHRCIVFGKAKYGGQFPRLATDKSTSRLLPVLVVALVELVPKERSIKTHRALLSIIYPTPAVSDP